MKLIFGLGNPGKEYEKTYHNLGFMVIDELCKKYGILLNKSKFNSIFGQGKINDEIVIVVKPLTYMNLSGNSVKSFVDYYKLSPQDVIVVCDDIDLPKGTCRYRERGSGGTHNGLKNIVFKLNSENFKRVKIGAARQDSTTDLKDYVLSKIDEESFNKILSIFNDSINKIVGCIGK